MSNSSREKLVSELIALGVTESQAYTLTAGKYSNVRIVKNIEYAKSRYSTGKINNLGGFVIRAIESDFAHAENKSSFERAKAAEVRQIREQEQKKDFEVSCLKDLVIIYRDHFKSWDIDKQEKYKELIFARLNPFQARFLGGKSLEELINSDEFIRNYIQVLESGIVL